MPKHLRRSAWPTILLCAAILSAGTIVPLSASARPIRVHARLADAASRAEERASRTQERIQRAEERATRRHERQAQRAEERAAKAQQRAEERAARAQQRAEGLAGDDSTGAPGQASSQPGESGAGTTSPRSAALGSSCQVSLDASSHRVSAGDPVTLLGVVTCPSGKSAAGESITLYQRHSGAGLSSFAAAATTAAKADGSYEFTVPAVDTNTIFRVRDGRRGAHTSVKVAPVVTIASAATSAQASTTRAGARLAAKATFTGTVSPASEGAAVVLQVVAYPGSGEQWRSVALGRVAADGSYSIAHRFRTPGEMTVRAVVHPGRLSAPAASESLTYEVLQPQNPQLTVQTSADPLSYGQSVTISGVAAGVANQPVTLLARTHGGAFSVAAQTTTDSAGNYSFTQAPLANTYYRVIDSTAKSTILFEGVRYALTVVPPATAPQAGQQTAFTGTVAPGAAGEVVYLQRRNASGIGFHDVASAAVNPDLTYSIAYTFPRATTEVMRVKIAGDLEHQATASEALTVQIVAAAEGAPEAAAPSSEAP